MISREYLKGRRSIWLATAIFLAIGVGAMTGHTPVAHAAGFVVDTTSDANLTACTAAAGDCSLRGAINNANGLAGADTITFDAAVFNPGTILLTGALPNITTDVTITGLGATLVTVDGANLHRPFNIGGGATVAFSGLTIAHGSSVDGGGLYSEGTLTVANSTVSSNRASGSGGGIVNYGGTLTVASSTFSGNSAGSGGAIRSPIGGTVTVTNSTFSGNTTTFGGAVVYSWGGTTTLTNVTVSGSTVGSASALYVEFAGVMNLNNSIVANTTGGSGDCANDNGGIVNAQNSLIESGLGCVNGTNSANLTGDPNLGALANNGGTTQTLALLPGSSAINAGSNALVPGGVTTDQRGAARIMGGTVDMGAYEEQNPTAVTLAEFGAAQVDARVQVTWVTVSELNNQGFNLYRSTTPDPVGDLLAYVPSQAPGSTQGFAYTYDDADVQPGQTYWYWLEDVDLNGATTLHGPVSATVQAPTAVTLASVSASPAAAPAGAALPWLLAVAGAGAALALRRRRR